MTNNVVRALGAPGGSGGPLGKRAAHRLSDGSLVMVVADNNRTGVAGATGDGSNTSKIYIYQNTDAFGNGAWTLKATIVTSLTAAGSYIEYSSAVDSSNNVHVSWIDSATTVKWVNVTYSAGTFTVGSATSIYTAAGGFNLYRVDIDCFANGQAVVGLYTASVTGAGSALGAKATVIVLSSAGAPIYTKTTQILSGVTEKANSEDITITATHDAIVSNVGSWMMIASAQPSSGTDSGDCIFNGGVNLATGAELNFTTGVNIPVNGKQYRRYMLFCVNGAREIAYGYISAGAGATFGYRRGTINSDYSVSWESTLATTAISGAVLPNPPDTGGFYTTSIAYEDNTSGVMTFVFSNAGHTRVASLTAQTFSGLFRNGPDYLDQGFTPITGSLTCLSGGSNRNLASGQVNFLAHYSAAGFYARFLSPAIPLAPANVLPANGATVQTGLPSVGQDFRLSYAEAAGSVNAFYYVAKDAGMTTNRKSINSPNSYTPGNTDPAHLAKVSDLYSLNSSPSLELSQGVWFIAGYTIDEWGRSSPASAVGSFTVSHPPAPSSLSPTGAIVLSYGSGNTSFSWRFTDPYVNDFQTGFQLQIQDVNGSSVYDSGIVHSTSTSATVTIPSAYRDVQLKWRLSLLDKDSVQGAFSDWQVFYVSDPPVAVITSPTTGQVFTTGVPIVSWTNGIGVNKSQTSYAVRIIDATTGQTVYYSDIVASAATSHTIPTGFIHNGKTYVVSVTLTDSLGLTSTSSTVGFTTSWTPPASADLVRTYLYRYISDGYIFVGWSSANIDPRFIAWNLYRRIIGDTNWTQLESFSNVQSSYGYRDYDVRSGKLYQYAVTQVVIVSGDQIESSPIAQAQVTVPSASYWLVDPLGVVQSVPIFSVTADKYTNEQETAVYNVVGVGRHVDEGDDLGVNGSLTIELRDKATGLISSINQFLNPSMQSRALVNSPDSWTVAGIGNSGSITTDYITFYEPAPNGYLNNLIIRSSLLGNATTDAITVTQSITIDRLPSVPGTVFEHSEWFSVENTSGNVTTPPIVKSKVSYFSASGTSLGVETIAAVQVDTYEPSGTGDANTGAWQRYKARHTMPLNTDHMTVQTMIQTATAGQYGIIAGGSSLEKAMTPYFDGDSRGADWTGAEFFSSSYTTGYYTATEQREDIDSIKKIGRPVILKTPFGQSFYVKLMDDDFDRMAGVTAEFGTMTLPYLEVAF